MSIKLKMRHRDLLYGKPWLQSEDPLWSQQLLWNIHRDNWLKCYVARSIVSEVAKKCPLIEEAQWFLKTIPDRESMGDEETLKVILAAGKTPRHQAYFAILSSNYDLIRDAATNGDPMAQYTMSRVSTPEGKIY